MEAIYVEDHGECVIKKIADPAMYSLPCVYISKNSLLQTYFDTRHSGVSA